MAYADNYFDYEKGWENTNENWYSAKIERTSHKIHTDMVEWLYENLDNPERHCRWISFKRYSEFRFRYEKDCAWFTLRWS